MIKRLLTSLVAALTLCGTSLAQYVTLAGTLQSSNGMPASNYILSFQLSQFGFVSGTGVVINAGTYCATSTDGTVVGVPNPLQAPIVTTGFTGTLPPANYYVKIALYDAANNLTLVSPERVIALGSTGQLQVAAPISGLPAGASGMKVYISTSPNTETLQGTSTGSAAFIQSIPLVTGANPSSSNTTLCKQVANDVIWPSGTGYTVALTDTGGNTLPGYPMMWQLMGPNTTINLSTGLPYYHGTVYFPTPILASPLNHALQTISGPLGLSGYDLINVGAIGVGTSLPAWPIDVENGLINTNLGYLVNGAGGTTGQCLGSNGTAFNTPINCLTAASLFYQTVQSNTTPATQRAALNFTDNFTVTDASSRTTVDLAAQDGYTPGSFTNPTVVVNGFGIITGITNGPTTTLFTAVHDALSSRAWSTVYHNTTGFPMFINGNGSAMSGSSTATIACVTGASSSPTTQTYRNSWGATFSGQSESFSLMVPAGYFYECVPTGDIGSTPGSWTETY